MMRGIDRVVGAVVALLGLGLVIDGAFAQGVTYRDARGYVCYQAPGVIEVDGALDDPGWAGIPWTETFGDIEGDVKPRPRFETRAKMAWDDQYFYFAADMEEPHVWGTLTEHDSVIFQDNDFEIFLDPDGDNHQYYEFEINALNTGWDLRLVKPYRDGGPALNEWEIPGLKTGVDIRGTLNDPSDVDEGWSVEIAIPWEVLAEFTSVPAPPRDGDLWRANFSRVEWKHTVENGQYRKVPGIREDNWVWSPQGVIDMHRPERWGYVMFTTRPVGEAEFRPDPDAPARDVMIDLYYAQRAFNERNQRYAENTGELDFAVPDGFPTIQITPTDDGYTAAMSLPATAELPARRLEIRQDSRITVSAVDDDRD